MALKIIVYGHGDTSAEGFPTEADFIRWINAEVMAMYGGRYRYTQAKDADVIVLSRKGKAFGDLEIEGKGTLTAEDTQIYPKAKCVYLVRLATLYKKPVPLSRIGIRVGAFGVSLSEEDYQAVRNAGEM